MKTLFVAMPIVIALGAPAFAQFSGGGGNIAGTEYSGEPFNSSVHSSARNPETGLTPGGERDHGIRPGTRAYGQVYTPRKVCWRDDFGRRHCRLR